MTWRALMIFIMFLASSCAYNYAGKEGKVAPEPRETQDSRVVELKTEPEVVVEDPPKVVSNSPCSTPTIDLQFFDASTQVVRTLDCNTRKFLNVKRTPLGETTYQERRASGLPEARWYFLVDPTGTRTNYPNNDVLLKVSQNFKIEFYGRETGKGLLVYLFLEELG
ncbi:MAG: hypothetical protein R3E66_22045 [bacterium]